MQELVNHNKISLENLCKLADISTEYGWEKILAKHLGFTENRIYSWTGKNRKNISKPGIKEIENQGYPKEEWLIEEGIKYKQGKKTILKVKSNKIPYGPETNDTQIYLKKAIKVFNSNEKDIIERLRADIDRSEEDLNKEIEIKKLRKGAKRFENFDCGPAVPADDVEEGGG